MSIPGARVLLVDDEPLILHGVSRLLERRGFSVRTSATGADAIAALGSEPFDAVVCDLHMPQASGEQVYAAIVREHPALVSRLVFASGDLGGAPFLARASCHTIAKPYVLDELVGLLHRIAGIRTSDGPAPARSG